MSEIRPEGPRRAIPGRPTKRGRCGLTGALIALGLSPFATVTRAAAESTVESVVTEVLEDPARTERPAYLTVALGAFAQPRVRSGAATLDERRVDASFGTAFPPTEGLLLTAGIDLAYTSHRWEDSTKLALAEPIRDRYTARFSPGFVLSITEGWTLIVAGDLDSSFADDAELGDSLTYGGITILSHRVTDTLTIAGVLIVKTRLDRDVQVLPVGGFEWTPTAGFTVELTGDVAGPTLRARHRFADHWWWSLAGRFEDEIYRIDLAANDEGTFEDERITALGGITWRPGPRLAIGLRAGVALSDEVRIDSAAKGRVGSVSFDPSPVVGLMLDLGI